MRDVEAVTAKYEAKYRQFRMLYPSLKEFFNRNTGEI